MSYIYSSDDFFGTGMLLGLLEGVPSVILGIVTYILSSLGLYTIAKRRGLNHPWLAWIPVANVWLLGSLSDQYRYVVRGENKSKRKVLLTLNIITAVLSVAIIVSAVVMVGQIVIGAANGMSETAFLQTMVGPMVCIVGLCLPVMGVSIAYAIIYYMALYDVYKSLDPSNCVLFLVLSIVFGVTEPFLLFFNRNKDQGMPPRRAEPVYMPPEQTWQEPENKDYL